MADLDYIDALGMGEPSSEENTELETNVNKPTDNPDNEDLSLDSTENVETTNEESDTKENTVPPELVEMKKQIEGMEKRLADKDAYIEQLRQESMSNEESGDNTSDTEDGVEEDFWDDPVGYVKKMKEEFANQTQIQQLQINETIYANTVDNYWKTVNQDALKEAVATDAEFSEKFNNSKEPYKVAYEYLSEKANTKTKSEQALRDKIKAELLEEMGTKRKKDVVPSTNNLGGKSGDGKSNEVEDGFMAVFGR